MLKVLFSQEHGSTIGAATFGLPEAVGGNRNWDYRYTWLRDSSFSLYSLVRLGFSEEVRVYTNWLRARVLDGLSTDNVDGPLRPLYRSDGGNDLGEIELRHLSGYRDSSPVWIGNGASSQLQLDIYGEVMMPSTSQINTRMAFRRTVGGASAKCSVGWVKTGIVRMRASGRCAGRDGIGSIPV